MYSIVIIWENEESKYSVLSYSKMCRAAGKAHPWLQSVAYRGDRGFFGGRARKVSEGRQIAGRREKTTTGCIKSRFLSKGGRHSDLTRGRTNTPVRHCCADFENGKFGVAKFGTQAPGRTNTFLRH